MGFSIAAKHARGKAAKDKIFAANDAANKAAAKYGRENVVNATLGSILDEDGRFCCLPTVEQAYRALPMPELMQYAGIDGLPEFLDAVVKETCGQSRPDAEIGVIATAGATGAVHHAVWNYTNEGDKILTSDWYWGAYSSICRDMLRSLDTYKMFDKNNEYNVVGLLAKTRELAAAQDNVALIVNTPAHNPVGYTITDAEWDGILAGLETISKETGKNIVLIVDLAYLDYTGEREETRRFIKKFEKLPKELLVILAYSMSKGFTLYGQRTGAMIGISSDAGVIEEFTGINSFSSRATWSNVNRPCMRVLANICKDPALLAAVGKERDGLFRMIKARGDIFTREAKEAGLPILPYAAGFFLSIESGRPEALCAKLHEDNIYAVPLAKGIRIAVCAVSQAQMRGLAAKVKKAFDAVGN
ncbi:MAG: aminotransferase class I/II-fold pyridoxal phosphate-dependent enzyme [Acidaminococcales bacterium]|jgi:aromatic-amino-acid transaminase|nr:aminotransferase class I/II-fold pyridoxal phosphate-dependent enzyme [Acidaminococcales bacterium]